MGGGIGLGMPFAPGDPMAVRASGGQADLALVWGGLNREGGVQRGMIRDGKRQGPVWCRAPVALDKAGRTVVTALNSGTRIELGHPWISLTSSGTLDLNCGGKVRFRGGRIDLEEAGGRWSGLPLKGPKPTVRMPGAPHRAGSLRSRAGRAGQPEDAGQRHLAVPEPQPGNQALLPYAGFGWWRVGVPICQWRVLCAARRFGSARWHTAGHQFLFGGQPGLRRSRHAARRPAPDTASEIARAVQDRLLAAVPVGVAVEVDWLPVRSAGIDLRTYAAPGADAAVVKDRINRALNPFLSPIPGAEWRGGWPLAAPCACLRRLAGRGLCPTCAVDHVTLRPCDPMQGAVATLGADCGRDGVRCAAKGRVMYRALDNSARWTRAPVPDGMASIATLAAHPCRSGRLAAVDQTGKVAVSQECGQGLVPFAVAPARRLKRPICLRLCPCA